MKKTNSGQSRGTLAVNDNQLLKQISRPHSHDLSLLFGLGKRFQIFLFTDNDLGHALLGTHSQAQCNWQRPNTRQVKLKPYIFLPL